ncbi:GLUT4 regulating protein TUG-domain-containing protein [Cercophora newfieldiana]|uniref:GLUT4 regulating protein TUG-domain-containing protein n=1 Tax=Cercophora newfieldiana TaxID=92897 RepID=A0AA40D1H7_9PEZI|nr:GLUT4 regulating protein TUG-domain-containing protein [Cercophora newfieldiana]
MSTHVEVVTADFRRSKIKITPGTYLVDVLNEACQKHNLSSDKYLLKHKQKIVDLSGPFRTSGLAPGAKLELVQKSNSPSVVSIALDVNGSRFTKKLPSDMVLWQVMRQFESAESGLNITAKASDKTSNAGQVYHDAPVVNIMGREYSTIQDLQKTLSQCGINSGSMVLRVSFRSTEKTLYAAMNEISQYLEDVGPAQKVDAAPKPAITEPPVVSEPLAEEGLGSDAAKQEPTEQSSEPVGEAGPLKDSDAMDVDKAPAANGNGDPLQPTSVFSAPSSSTPAAARIQVDDSMFEPTIAHAQLHQTHLEARTRNTRLKSDAELAADAALAAAKLAKITRVDVKVRFPDQTSAQWVINPEHRGSFLYQAVRTVMEHPNQPFKLTMSGPNPVTVHEDDKRLIADYKFKGRELLNLSWDGAVSADARKAPFLKGNVASRAQAIVVPEIAETTAGDTGSSAGPSKAVKQEKHDSKPDSEDIRKKIGKFFKLPGKK